MSDAILAAVQQPQLKTDLPNLSIGATVNVHYRIIEGEKERIQIFTGVIIAMKGDGLEKTVTVRRIVANEGVERVFPVHSPRIAKIELVRHGHVRRSKLFYLRERVGKKRNLRDRQRGLKNLLPDEPAEAAPRSEEAAAEAEAPKAPPKPYKKTRKAAKAKAEAKA